MCLECEQLALPDNRKLPDNINHRRGTGEWDESFTDSARETWGQGLVLRGLL